MTRGADGPRLLAGLDFDQLADDLFQALQLGAERQAILRGLVNRAGERGLHAAALMQEEARCERLARLLNLIWALVPFEGEVLSLLAAVLEGTDLETAVPSRPAA